MKYLSLIIIAFLAACNNRDLQSKESTESTVFVSHDTIPDVRTGVSKKPVASYRVTVGDPKLEREFGVSIYETPFTFKYLLKMQYEAIEETDTLKIPNFGSWPVVQVQPGKDKLSCIIGFLDEKKNFKEYKMLSAKGNKMSLTVLKKYGVGRYRTVFK